MASSNSNASSNVAPLLPLNSIVLRPWPAVKNLLPGSRCVEIIENDITSVRLATNGDCDDDDDGGVSRTKCYYSGPSVTFGRRGSLARGRYF